MVGYFVIMHQLLR